MSTVAWRSLSAMVLALLTVMAVAASRAEDVFAPDFTLRRASGEAVTLSGLRGNAVVVVFWATWCPYCERLLPGIQKLADFYEGEKLKVLAVDIWDEGDTTAYTKLHGLRLEVLLDGDEVAAQWGVMGTPTTFVLDAAGRVLLRTSSSDPDDPRIADTLDAALKQSP